jgi:hypothetical protein
MRNWVWAGGLHVAARPSLPSLLPPLWQGPVMHAACSSNGNGCRHAPETSPTTSRLGAAFAEPAAPPENGTGGRDAKGRFAPGNAGGPGNPFARRTAELRREFLAEATGEGLRAVCRALLERAKGGDVAAAKLALSYLVGKPERAVGGDPSHLLPGSPKQYQLPVLRGATADPVQRSLEPPAARLAGPYQLCGEGQPLRGQGFAQDVRGDPVLVG